MGHILISFSRGRQDILLDKVSLFRDIITDKRNENDPRPKKKIGSKTQTRRCKNKSWCIIGKQSAKLPAELEELDLAKQKVWRDKAPKRENQSLNRKMP